MFARHLGNNPIPKAGSTKGYQLVFSLIYMLLLFLEQRKKPHALLHCTFEQKHPMQMLAQDGILQQGDKPN